MQQNHRTTRTEELTGTFLRRKFSEGLQMIANQTQDYDAARLCELLGAQGKEFSLELFAAYQSFLKDNANSSETDQSSSTRAELYRASVGNEPELKSALADLIERFDQLPDSSFLAGTNDDGTANPIVRRQIAKEFLVSFEKLATTEIAVLKTARQLSGGLVPDLIPPSEPLISVIVEKCIEARKQRNGPYQRDSRLITESFDSCLDQIVNELRHLNRYFDSSASARELLSSAHKQDCPEFEAFIEEAAIKETSATSAEPKLCDAQIAKVITTLEPLIMLVAANVDQASAREAARQQYLDGRKLRLAAVAKHREANLALAHARLETRETVRELRLDYLEGIKRSEALKDFAGVIVFDPVPYLGERPVEANYKQIIRGLSWQQSLLLSASLINARENQPGIFKRLTDRSARERAQEIDAAEETFAKKIPQLLASDQTADQIVGTMLCALVRQPLKELSTTLGNADLESLRRRYPIGDLIALVSSGKTRQAISDVEVAVATEKRNQHFLSGS